MLVLTQEVINKIDKILERGDRNRNEILYNIISEDKELKEIVDMYRNKKNAEDIMIEKRISIEKARNALKVIDDINRTIDKKIIFITSRRSKQKKLLQKQQNLMNKNDELEL